MAAEPQSTSKIGQSLQGFEVFGLAILSAGILWFAFPPVGGAILGWVALVPLVWIALLNPGGSVEQGVGHGPETAKTKRATYFSGRPYRQLYLAGLIYWLSTFYFIPYPHPLLWFGWLAVSLYLAVYTPLTIWGTRSLIKKCRMPIWVAFPVTFTVMEWTRCWFATGMGLVCLAHTQFRSPAAIQVADLSGQYTLTFLIATCNVGIACLSWQWGGKFWRGKTVGLNLVSVWPSVFAAIGAVAITFGYGNYRMNQIIGIEASGANVKIGLVQTSHDVIFAPMTSEQVTEQFDNKYRLTYQVVEENPDLDLVVWPESAFAPYRDLLSDFDEQVTVEVVSSVRREVWANAIGIPRHREVPLLTGGTTQDPSINHLYGSAFLIGNQGEVTHRYFKNHRVMFGEYVPILDWFPRIRELTPVPSIQAGTESIVIPLDGVKLVPNICFESTVAHFIRRQVNDLAKRGSEPDVMVNLTNDGWFFGSSCLDFHLASNVFRAVEMRKPMLVCANTGFSAHINELGQMVKLGPRRQEAVLVADVQAKAVNSPYRVIADWIPLGLGAWVFVCCGLSYLEYRNRPATDRDDKNETID